MVSKITLTKYRTVLGRQFDTADEAMKAALKDYEHAAEALASELTDVVVRGVEAISAATAEKLHRDLLHRLASDTGVAKLKKLCAMHEDAEGVTLGEAEDGS